MALEFRLALVKTASSVAFKERGLTQMDVIQRNHVQQQLHANQAAPVLLYAHGFGCDQEMWGT